MEGLRRVAGCGSFGAEVLDPELPSETLSAALHTHGFLLFRHPTHPLAGLSASGLVDFVAERFPRLRANRNGAKNAVDGVVGTLGNTIDPESGLFSSDFMPAVGMAEVRPHCCRDRARLRAELRPRARCVHRTPGIRRERRCWVRRIRSCAVRWTAGWRRIRSAH